MIVWIYLAVLLVSFLGLMIGILVSNMVVEEIANASKYLRYINLIWPPLIVLISTYGLNKIYSILFTIILAIILLIFRKKNNDAWIYSCMSALLYISILSQETLNITIIIFIYGISISTINVAKYFKNKVTTHINRYDNIVLIKDTLKNYSYYLVIGVLFLGIFTYLL
jgi:hypothetical protein